MKSLGLSHTEKLPGGGNLETRDEDSACFCQSANLALMTEPELECPVRDVVKETCYPKGGGKAAFKWEAAGFVF